MRASIARAGGDANDADDANEGGMGETRESTVFLFPLGTRDETRGVETGSSARD